MGQFQGYLDPRLKEAVIYIHKNYGRPLYLSEIAKEVGLSPSGLRHLFRKQFGDSCMAHVRSIRLQKALELLRDRKLRISEIAYRVGYSGLSNFCRDFKECFNKTPSLYRKSL